MKAGAKKMIRGVVLLFLGLLCVGVLIGSLLLFYFSKNLPTIEQISSRYINQSTKIFDRTGEVLLYEISDGQERTIVPLERIPKYLKDATVAIEDERFYEEPAFDWKGIARALVVNLRHRQARQGASTITQQLAKNAFLTPEQTIARKIKEILLATRINQHYTKDEIIALYLNEIPYGATIYGVEAAGQAFFEKPVSELSLAESAVIAALPKAPSYYSPWGSHVKELLSRQGLVLKKMLELGMIAQKEHDEAIKSEISFSPQRKGIKAPHFVMAVQEYLVQKYGEDIVRKGGLRVITTLDWKLQQAAQKAVIDGAKRNEELYGGKNAALVAEDPKTGQILALIGSRNYFEVENDGNFDVATQGLRQPGSALKPFVYLAAFEKGLTPNTVLFDLPTEFAANNPICPAIPDFENENKECFHPQNYTLKFSGPISIRTALSQSINIPAVKALYIAGVENVVEKAKSFGLVTLSNPGVYGLSLVLGGGAVRLVNLVEAYSALSQDGIKHGQVMVVEVKNADGKVLELYKDEFGRVVEEQPVRLINSILSDVEARRGLFGAGVSLTTFPGYDVAFKTGTSNDYRDAWTLGYTPSLVVGVWAGNNDNSPMHRHGSSILAAVPIWNSFMSQVIKEFPQDTFTKPEPSIPKKPVLVGDYLNNKQIHSILYYIDKKDPLGDPPQRPENDPQFANWEQGVLLWAQNNIPDFKDYNQRLQGSVGTSTSDFPPPQVEIQKPNNGESIGNTFDVHALLTSSIPLSAVKIYWNGAIIDEVGAAGTNFIFSKTYTRPNNTKPQNLLEVEALDQGSAAWRASIIVYGQ